METPGDRLRKARQDSGFATIAAASHHTRFHRQNLADHESGRRRFTADQAVRYARAFKVSPQWLMFGDAPETLDPATLYSRIEEYEGKPRFVKIMGEVQAGVWTEPSSQERIEGELPILLPSYSRAHLFALRVVGRSMDLYYAEGTLLVVCPAAEAGVREGDHVIARRTRNGLIETTVKEVAMQDGRPVLLPRSSDPAHMAAIPLQGSPDSDDGIEIIGVVVASQTNRGPRSGPLLM